MEFHPPRVIVGGDDVVAHLPGVQSDLIQVLGRGKTIEVAHDDRCPLAASRASSSSVS